ncbi:MAG: RNA 3'-terminal phosphate cyclase [Haliangiales bacterium]
MKPTIVIDGSQGEGGGQIVRTAMALAAITNTPLVLDNIRAGRAKPGLMRQHLTAVRAVAAVSGGQLSGDQLGATRLRFEPGALRGGEYRFAVATAGSACLVFQTVLWPLLAADGPSRVVFEGGTHNSKAPPFDFLQTSFLPLVRRMGAQVTAELSARGFYPAGGGRFEVAIEPGALTPIELFERGPVELVRARALVANLSPSIARRELAVVRDGLGWPAERCVIERVAGARGAGNALMLELSCGDVAEVITGFGAPGRSAERVADEAVSEARAYLAAGMPVGVHLADQLLVPMALAGGGGFASQPLSLHSRTNIDVIGRFLSTSIEVEEDQRGALVRFSR